jgi:hypothetical protein
MTLGTLLGEAALIAHPTDHHLRVWPPFLTATQVRPAQGLTRSPRSGVVGAALSSSRARLRSPPDRAAMG